MGSVRKFHKLIELENQKEIELKSIVINRYYRRIALTTLVHTLNNKVFLFSVQAIRYNSNSIRNSELENWRIEIVDTMSMGLSVSGYCENSLISICLKLLIDFAMNKYYAMIAICSCCCRYRYLWKEFIYFIFYFFFHLIFEFGACRRRCAFCGPFKPRIICWILLFCYLQRRCWRRCPLSCV